MNISETCQYVVYILIEVPYLQGYMVSYVFHLGLPRAMIYMILLWEIRYQRDVAVVVCQIHHDKKGYGFCRERWYKVLLILVRGWGWFRGSCLLHPPPPHTHPHTHTPPPPFEIHVSIGRTNLFFIAMISINILLKINLYLKMGLPRCIEIGP